MKGVLFIGGAAPEYKTVEHELEDSEIIVAADSGFDSALKMGISPDIIIGDMDSIQSKSIFDSYPQGKIIRFSKDKDKTDTELGISYLIEKKIDKIVIIGGGAGRMDHFLGIVFLFDRVLSPDIWYTHSARFQKITGTTKVSFMKGRIVSFFPVGRDECRMKSKGLKWPLNNLVWNRGDMGISNLAVDDPFYIEMIKGRLIMVSQLEEEEVY